MIKKTFQISHTVTQFKENDEWFLYNWLNGEYAIIFDPSHYMYQALENKVSEFEEFFYEDSLEDFLFLIEKKFLVFGRQEIFNELDLQYQSRYDNSHLSLILLPINQACNFSCVYCYEDHNQKQRMTDVHKDILLKFIKQHGSLKSLSIEYFGGEPLLNSKFIIDFNTACLYLSKEKEFVFTSSVTTNGFLLNLHLFNELYNLNSRYYQITLDGLPEDHNRLRPSNSGDGTFDTIFHNLKQIHEFSGSNQYFNIVIRVNFNENTATFEKRHQFLNLLKTNFGDDKRFSVLFRQIGDYSALNYKKSNANYELCSHKVGSELKKMYEDEAIEYGLELAEMMTFTGNGSSSCYAGKANSLVIFPDFKVQKCTVAIDNDINTVGEIDNNGVFIKNDNWDKWVQPSLFSKSDCKKCHYVSQCQSSACPLVNIQNDFAICPPDKINAIVNAKRIILHLEKN
jgi:uncharacterized protein